MSLRAMIWALDTAVVDDAAQLLVLIALAERADDDGRNAWPGRVWLAERARCSTRTVQRHLNALRARGLIVEGDQRLVTHLRADRRPTVYDLVMIPGSRVDGERGDNVTPRSAGRSEPAPTLAAGPDDVTPVTGRTCGKPANDETQVSPRTGSRGDIHGRHGVTPVAHKPSLLPSEETTTTPSSDTDPVDNHRLGQRRLQQEQPRSQDLADGTAAPEAGPFDLRALQEALDRAGFDAVRWSLRPVEINELARLLAVHGVDRLVRAAVHASQAHPRPPGHARAWLTLWRDLRSIPKARRAPGCDQCMNGFLGHDDTDRLMPCPRCRPHLKGRDLA